MSRTLVRAGSVKDLMRDEKGLLFHFTNRFSAFDVGTCPQEIPGKGACVCQAAVQSFKIARTLGIPTCFLEQVDETTIRVSELQVISDRPLTATDEQCIVPAEWIFRFNVAGSLRRAFLDGKKKPTNFGFSSDEVPLEGTPLPIPVHQWTTKWEDTDRELTPVETLALCGLTEVDVSEYWRMIDTLNGAINFAFRQAGYARYDGKIEVGLGSQRRKLIADVFGTPDEDRPVSLTSLASGDTQHFGKEFLRQHLINVGYFDQLKKSRAAKEADQPYPLIPDEVIEETARRYRMFVDSYSEVMVRL